MRTWRQARGWDVPEMARRLRRAARELRQPAAEQDGLVRMIYAWERDAHAVTERYLLLYARAADVDPSDITRGAGVLSPSDLKGDEAPVLRREFGLATLGALAGAFVPGRAVTAVSAEHVAGLQGTAAGLWKRDRQVGGSALLSEAKGYFRTAREWLDSATYTTAVGADLLAVTAELAACAGFIAFDASDQATARNLLTESLILSGSDPVLSSHACALLAMQSSSVSASTGHPGLAREALRFLDQAAQVARHEQSAKLHAVVSMRRSLAAALLGDASRARRHIDGARRELDRGDDARDPEWFAFVTPTEITAHEATAAMYLGQPEHAAGIFRDVLADASLSARNKVFYSAQLAGALEAAGDYPEAVRTGLGVLENLEGAVRSGRTLNILKPVRGNAECGDEFAFRYDALVSA